MRWSPGARIRLKPRSFAAACLAAATLCSITSARAQTAGAVPPAQSFSLDDDGTALNSNPAGLGFVSGFEVDFLHSGSYAAERADALLFTGGLGPVALGVGWDWVRNGGLSCPACLGTTFSTRRSSLGAALRLGDLSVGVVRRGFHGGVVDGLSSWDAGLMLRPFSWLSLGAAALDLDQARSLPRRWALSFGLRPLGESPEISGDLRWTECTNAAGPCGLENADALLGVRLQVARGIHLLGQAGRLQGGSQPVSVLAGVELDLSHLGVTYAPLVSSGNNDGNYRDAWRVRLSTDRWQALSVVTSRAAEINLDKALENPRPGPVALVFGTTSRDPLAQTIAALHRLAIDPGIKAVVLRTSGLSMGMGKGEELRTAIQELQAYGKKVVFYLESAGDLEYSVAAAADRVYAAPQAVLLVNGLSATTMFAGAGLDKLGVKAEFFRVGAYKNAPDLFTRSSMSKEQREVQSSLLDDVYARYLKEIVERRQLDEKKVKGLLDKGILQPGEAVQAGLLDGLLYPDQLEAEVGKLLGGKVALEKTSVEPPATRETRWGPSRKMVVVRVEGDILRGEGVRGPFGAVNIAGSDPITRRIRRAADDPDVAAIVVRIDSPGGDGNASDLIWRELVRARKEKKKIVIASMGDVAASGGYYVAAGTDEIWAEPSTVTGSIGVFVGHFDAEELFAKLGLTFATTKRGQSADLFGPERDLDDAERKTLQAWVDNFYADFVGRVAEARHMKKEDVDAIARGRVWTGAQAAERGLVDHLGGFDDALRSARTRAHLPDDVQIDDETVTPVEITDLAGVSLGLAPRVLRALQALGEPGTLRAILPYQLEIR